MRAVWFKGSGARFFQGLRNLGFRLKVYGVGAGSLRLSG